MKRTQLRLGVRLARRELRRRPWRTVLVLLMVFIPCAAMTVVATYTRTSDWSTEDRIRAEYGRADLLATGSDEADEEDISAIRSALPSGARVQVEHVLPDRVRQGDRRTYFELSDLRVTDPMSAGRFGSLSGRVPATASEAVITRELADRLHLGIGGTFRPDLYGRTVRVVGVVVPNVDREVAYVGAPLDPHDAVVSWVLIDLPGDVGVGGAHAPNLPPTRGWDFEKVASRVHQREAPVFWTYVGGGVALVVLATIITAAFAVGARRQLRSIGLLSASGASPTTVKWFLVAEGAVAGFIGALSGIVVASIGVQFTPDDWLLGIAERPLERPIVRVVDLVPILVLGTIVAAGAAWLPARSTSQTPTLQALAGRRPLPPVPRRLPVFGLASVIGGCALLAMAVAGSDNGGSSLWALVAITGSLMTVLGAVAVAPRVVTALERGDDWLRGSWRLAGRSLARSRVRSSAVIGAICAISIVVVAAGALYESNQSRSSTESLERDQIIIDTAAFIKPVEQPDGTVEKVPAGPSSRTVPEEVIDRIRDVVPKAEVIPLLTVAPRRGTTGDERSGAFYLSGDGVPAADHEVFHLGVATPALLDHLEVPADLRGALDRGRAIAVQAAPNDVQAVQLELPGQQTVPFGGSFISPHTSNGLPVILIGSRTAESLGLDPHPSSSTLVALPSELTRAQRDRLELINEDIQWEQGNPLRSQVASTWVYLALPPQPPALTADQLKVLLLAVSLVLVLGVVGVGLALAAQDSEDERQVLAAVGAPPRVVRRVAALRAALLVLVATAIAVPAGLLASASIVAAMHGNPEPTFRPDLVGLVFVLVVVPVVVGAVTWVGSRVYTLIRPPRPDVFAWGD